MCVTICLALGNSTFAAGRETRPQLGVVRDADALLRPRRLDPSRGFSCPLFPKLSAGSGENHTRNSDRGKFGGRGEGAGPAMGTTAVVGWSPDHPTDTTVRSPGDTSVSLHPKVRKTQQPGRVCQARDTDRRSCVRPASERRHTMGLPNELASRTPRAGVPALAITLVDRKTFSTASLAPPTLDFRMFPRDTVSSLPIPRSGCIS